MKTPAIVSFLWEAQLSALSEFFKRHGPLTVVTLSPYLSQSLIDVVDGAGGKLFVMDLELGDMGSQGARAEWEPLRELFGEHLEEAMPAALPTEDGDALAKVIGARLDAELPLLITLLHGLELAQQSHQLCLMIANEDVMPVSKVAIHWARTQGIPSLHLSHGLALVDPYTVHAQLVADIHAVYGQRGLEGYLDCGVPPERMRITGNPAWDKFFKLAGERQLHEADLRRRHGLREGEPIVVFGTTWSGYLTAHGDEGLFGKTLAAFIDACEMLHQAGVLINPIIKDRPPNYHFGERRFKELLADRGVDPRRYLYLVEDGPLWAACADVLVAVDSNYCVEAMLCGTPAISLQHPAHAALGPSYGADAGVLSVEAGELGEAIRRLLQDVPFRERQQMLAAQARPYFNVGTDGLASSRVAKLMGEMAVGLVPKLIAWLDSRLPVPAERALIEERLAHCAPGRPVLGLLVLDRGDVAALGCTLASLEQALPAPVQVTVFGAKAPLAEHIGFVQVHPDTVYEAINEFVAGSFSTTPVDWILLVDAGTEFTRAGPLLFCLELAEALANEAQSDEVIHAFYADEIQRSSSGALGALFKPDFNLDLMLSFPALQGRHWALRRRSFVELGGFDPVFGDACQLDFNLRLVLGCSGVGLLHTAEVLLIADAPRLTFNPSEQVAVERHLESRGYQATVQAFMPGRYHIDYGHSAQPLVSIFVAVRDNLPLLQRCVESLLEKTRYARYELLLVDCESQEVSTLQWLEGVEALQSQQIKVWRFAGDFNFSAAVNAVAMSVESDYLLLLSHDARVVQENWLEQLLNQAQRPEVGVVGAKVLDCKGRIEQAGIVLGLHEVAGRAFSGEEADAAGYMNRLQVTQNYNAVGSACMMVRRSSFVAAGGFDETQFRAFYGDVDLCLRIRRLGLLCVWTPHCTVLRDGVELPVQAMEGALSGQDALKAERKEMLRRWLPTLARDSAYNANLSLAGNGFSFGYGTRRVHRPLLPQILCYPADATGCGHYRVRQPFTALRDAGLVDGLISGVHLSPVELERFGASTVVFQRQITEAQIAGMRDLKELSRAFKVYELDDYLPNLPLKSMHREAMPRDIVKSLRQAVALTDRFVVSTQPLAEVFAGLHTDIRVVPNCLPAHWWGRLRSQRGRGRKPRVGWAGGSSHLGDLELIADVVRELAGEVEWVFFGMCPEKLRPYVHEFHIGLPIDQYPAKLASLDLDLALAPLEENLFNECKSNLRLLEYGACGFPVVCSDVLSYRGDLVATRVKNRFRDWVNAIRMHLADLDATAASGNLLRDQVIQNWMLDGVNLQRWHAAWQPD